MSKQENVYEQMKDDPIWKSLVPFMLIAISLSVCVFIGLFMDSQALQWFGAIMLALTYIYMASRVLKRCREIEQVRRELENGQ